MIDLLTPPKDPRSSFGQPNIDPTQSDISSIARGHLMDLRSKINSYGSGRGITNAHFRDLSERIDQALNPRI